MVISPSWTRPYSLTMLGCIIPDMMVISRMKLDISDSDDVFFVVLTATGTDSTPCCSKALYTLPNCPKMVCGRTGKEQQRTQIITPALHSSLVPGLHSRALDSRHSGGTFTILTVLWSDPFKNKTNVDTAWVEG